MAPHPICKGPMPLPIHISFLLQKLQIYGIYFIIVPLTQSVIVIIPSGFLLTQLLSITESCFPLHFYSYNSCKSIIHGHDPLSSQLSQLLEICFQLSFSYSHNHYQRLVKHETPPPSELCFLLPLNQTVCSATLDH